MCDTLYGKTIKKQNKEHLCSKCKSANALIRCPGKFSCMDRWQASAEMLTCTRTLDRAQKMIAESYSSPPI